MNSTWPAAGPTAPPQGLVLVSIDLDLNPDPNPDPNPDLNPDLSGSNSPPSANPAPAWQESPNSSEN